MGKINRTEFRYLMVSVLAFALISGIAMSREEVDKLNPVIDGWYTRDRSIRPWEVEYCRKEGGYASSGLNEGAVSSETIALSQLTVTLQAQKNAYEGPEGLQQLYALSYYIEPPAGQVSFSVRLIGDGIEFEIPGSTRSATAGDAGFGYFARYLEQNFTHAQIDYDGNYLRVPVVE